MRNLIAKSLEALATFAVWATVLMAGATPGRAAAVQLSPSCRAEAQHYIVRTTGPDGTLGAHLWAMDRLRHDYFRSNKPACAEEIFRKAVSEQQAYWDDVGRRYHCDQAGANGNVCRSQQFNSAWMGLIGAVLVPGAPPALASAPGSPLAGSGGPSSGCQPGGNTLPLGAQATDLLAQYAGNVLPAAAALGVVAPTQARKNLKPADDPACINVKREDLAAAKVGDYDDVLSLPSASFLGNCWRGLKKQFLQDMDGLIAAGKYMYTTGFAAMGRWLSHPSQWSWSGLVDGTDDVLRLLWNGVTEYLLEDTKDFLCYKKELREEKTCKMMEKVFTMVVLSKATIPVAGLITKVPSAVVSGAFRVSGKVIAKTVAKIPLGADKTVGSVAARAGQSMVNASDRTIDATGKAISESRVGQAYRGAASWVSSTKDQFVSWIGNIFKSGKTTQQMVEDAAKNGALTAGAAEVSTNAATSATTNAATSATTNAATSATTNAATSATTNAATSATTNAATSATTNAATSATTNAATSATTNAATNAATSATTNAATSATTSAATSATTSAATSATTSATTNAATSAATNAATSATTSAATSATTNAAGGAARSPAGFQLASERHAAEEAAKQAQDNAAEAERRRAFDEAAQFKKMLPSQRRAVEKAREKAELEAAELAADQAAVAERIRLRHVSQGDAGGGFVAGDGGVATAAAGSQTAELGGATDATRAYIEWIHQQFVDVNRARAGGAGAPAAGDAAATDAAAAKPGIISRAGHAAGGFWNKFLGAQIAGAPSAAIMGHRDEAVEKMADPMFCAIAPQATRCQHH